MVYNHLYLINVFKYQMASSGGSKLQLFLHLTNRMWQRESWFKNTWYHWLLHPWKQSYIGKREVRCETIWGSMVFRAVYASLENPHTSFGLFKIWPPLLKFVRKRTPPFGDTSILDGFCSPESVCLIPTTWSLPGSSLFWSWGLSLINEVLPPT